MDDIKNYAIAIANTILSEWIKKGEGITHIKLQKLIYFVFKKYLQTNKKPLAIGNFMALQNGPVCELAYSVFSERDRTDDDGKEITQYHKHDEGLGYFVCSSDNELHDALQYVIEHYGGLTEKQLIEIAHVKGGAWYKTREEGKLYIPFRYIAEEDWIEVEN